MREGVKMACCGRKREVAAAALRCLWLVYQRGQKKKTGARSNNTAFVRQARRASRHGSAQAGCPVINPSGESFSRWYRAVCRDSEGISAGSFRHAKPAVKTLDPDSF